MPAQAAAAGFVVLIPARLASTRLPRKPLADIGGLPMVVRVALQGAASGAVRVVVCADHPDIVAACARHGVAAILTADHHRTGTDRLAEGCAQLGLPPETVIVNVQGDEPLIPPPAIARVAAWLAAAPAFDVATAAHPLRDAAEFFDPNVVKVVVDAGGKALLFSRAPIPWSRDAFASARDRLPAGLPALRHIGLYAYRAGFLQRYPELTPAPIETHESLEQLRVLWHGGTIGVLQLDEPLPPGVDTPEDLARVRSLIGRGADGPR